MTYTSVIEEINSTRRKFKISVPVTSIQHAFEHVVGEIQSTAQIRGFRKGKAPTSLIRKFYMADVVKKAADHVVQDAFASVSKDVGFQIISHPKIEAEQQFDENKDFEFTATVDINPQIEIKEYANIPLKLNKSLEINIDEEVEKQLVNVGGESLDETKRAEVKQKLSDAIQKMNEELKVNAAYSQIVEYILEKNAFEAPESLVEDAIDKIIAEENGTKEKDAQLDAKNLTVRDQYREDATLQVKGVLALGHIARQEGVTVTNEEMVGSLMSFARMNKINPQSLVKRVGPQIYNEFRGQVMIHKVVANLMGQAQIEYADDVPME